MSERGSPRPSCCALLGAAAVIATTLAMAAAAPAAAAPVPLAQFGSAGSDAGEFGLPQDIAVDGAGDVYVADTARHRINVFGGDGTFIRAFGWGVDTGAVAFEVCTTASGCQAGTPGGGAGQLDDPEGLAIDGAGGLYVSDTDNARISVFSTAGPSFTRAFGWGVDTGAAAFEVCTTASGCQAGTPGGGAGQLDNPRGVELDGAGSLYVSDGFNDRISVFSTAGPSFTHAFGWGVDSGALAFEVCTTASGCETGRFGNGAGQLASPSGVALDGAGNLYVGGGVSARINVFATAGPSFTRAFGWGVDTGATAFEVCTTASGCEMPIPGAGAGQLDAPTGVGIDGTGNLNVVDTNNNRISAFATAGPSFTRAFGWGVDTGAMAFEVCTTASGCQVGSSGGGVGQLSFPTGLGIDCRGAVWVADTSNNRVQRFGEPGTPLPPCTSSGGGSGGGSSGSPLATVPSNHFDLGKLLKNKKKGIAFLLVNVPGPGELGLSGKGVQPIGGGAGIARKSLAVSGGEARLRIAPTKGKKGRKVRRKLREKGKAKLKVLVTYVPTGGLANTQTTKVKLVRR
ncbi:MAG: NHL repeat-containing protein [Solirubrobacterales bacterium]